MECSVLCIHLDNHFEGVPCVFWKIHVLPDCGIKLGLKFFSSLFWTQSYDIDCNLCVVYSGEKVMRHSLAGEDSQCRMLQGNVGTGKNGV